MFSRAEDWKTSADDRYIFLNCYALMSRNMVRALSEKEFKDQLWVDRLMHRFADYYFEALDHYNRGGAEVPEVWRQAHDFSRNKKLLAVQHLLLGINAHINYDLVLALDDVLHSEWSQMTPAQQRDRYLDHIHVNRIIARTVDLVQDEVIEAHSPWMDIIDRLCGRMDERLISSLICRWREEVWKSAIELTTAPSELQREVLRRKLEKKVLRRGKGLVTGY